jgi:hypothetical protein
MEAHVELQALAALPLRKEHTVHIGLKAGLGPRVWLVTIGKRISTAGIRVRALQPLARLSCSLNFHAQIHNFTASSVATCVAVALQPTSHCILAFVGYINFRPVVWGLLNFNWCCVNQFHNFQPHGLMMMMMMMMMISDENTQTCTEYTRVHACLSQQKGHINIIFIKPVYTHSYNMHLSVSLWGASCCVTYIYYVNI